MSWNDNVYEGHARKKSEESVKKLDLGDVYRWDSFLTVVSSGFRQYDAKVEYLVRHGDIVTCTVTSLSEPLADFDITSSLTKHELERVYDLAEHDCEQKKR